MEVVPGRLKGFMGIILDDVKQRSVEIFLELSRVCFFGEHTCQSNEVFFKTIMVII